VTRRQNGKKKWIKNFDTLFLVWIKSLHTMQSWDLWVDLLSGFDQVWAQVLWSLPYVGWILRWESLCFLLCFPAGVFCFLRMWKFCNIAVTAPAGFPDHPHRGLKIGLFLLLLRIFLWWVIKTPCSFFVIFSWTGFETVTYMLQVEQIAWFKWQASSLMLHFLNGKNITCCLYNCLPSLDKSFD